MAIYDFTYGEINSRQKQIDMVDKKTHSIILGCGGIGSWAALNLSLSGISKNIILVDPDYVEESNLNRTPFKISDIGRYKVDALKQLILERRIIDVLVYREKTSKELADIIFSHIQQENNNDTEIFENTVIIDCRDDVYNDFYHFKSKYYKLGYDGCSLTIDGNPRVTPVWGRSNNYEFTPSFICPAQLIANIVTIDISLDQCKNTELDNYYCDEKGQLNNNFTFDCQHLLKDLYLSSKTTTNTGENK